MVEPSVVTVGNFDGVHRGHQVLIQRALGIARQTSRPMLVLTFEPHPVVVLRGSCSHFLLTPGDLKRQFLEEVGATWLRVMPFTAEFARLAPLSFLDNVLAGDLKASHVVVGYNFTFGHKGAGDVNLLRNWGESRGIFTEIVEPWRDREGGQAVSSSWIRQLVQEGRIEEAEQFLGHPFAVQGVVQEGDHRGRQLGAPTINLIWPEIQVAAPYGVYAGMATIEGHATPLMAVANFGVRPTFGASDARLEIHLLEDFKGAASLYGKTVRFDLLHWLRAEKKFEDAGALSRQIRRDAEQARQLLQAGR